MTSNSEINKNIPDTIHPDNVSGLSPKNFSETIQVTRKSNQSDLNDTLGGYKLGEIIGWGGAGIVYEASDKDGVPAAIKIVKFEPGTPPEEIQRFIIEAETAKKLRQHPNIVTVYDAGCEGKNYYLAMELIKGGKTFCDLKYDEKTKTPTINQILDYAIDIADALSYAHKNAILHRDIKPANVLIDQFGKAKLSDFGIAKNLNAPKLTMTGTIMGTPHYMSPEQCGFGDGLVTKQSDIYSFGVMLYEILTGQMPYPVRDKDSIPEILKVICSTETTYPRRFRKEISRNLEAVILRMLDKEKKLRYKDMEDVKKDLIACREGKPVSVRKLTIAEKWEKWVRMNFQLALSIFGGIAAVFIVYFAFAMPKIKEYMYQKSKADLSAFSAKRKVFALEEELKRLKMQNEANENSAIGIKNARDLISQGKFIEAEKILEDFSRQAVIDSNKGMIIECSSLLGRIKIHQGKLEEAVAKFAEAVSASEPDSPLAELANFETAIALQMLGKTKDAESIFAKIAEKNRELEKSRYADNISKLSNAFIELAKTGSCKFSESEIENLSEIFRGLGYWINAQTETDPQKKISLLEKAAKKKNIFIWIKTKEEDKK